MNVDQQKMVWSAPRLEALDMAGTATKGGTTEEVLGVDS